MILKKETNIAFHTNQSELVRCLVTLCCWLNCVTEIYMKSYLSSLIIVKVTSFAFEIGSLQVY